MGSPRASLTRWFCVACAIAVLPLAPVALATIGRVRLHPIPLDGSRLHGTTVVTRGGTAIEAVRFGGGAWIGAASPEARRRFRNVPAGTEIAYRLPERGIVTGRVAEVRADAATVVRRIVLGMLALVMTLAGLALGAAGRNAAALDAGGFLAGLGATLGFGFLEPNAVAIAAPAWRDALIVAFTIVPAGLWCRHLLLLAAGLPSALPIGRGARIVIGGVTAIAIARAFLVALAQTGPVFDALPAPVARLAMQLLESELLQIAPYLATAVLTAVFVVRQLRTGRRSPAATDVRSRARVVAWGFAAGMGLPLAGAIVQFAALLATRRLAMPREAMALLLLPLLLVPASLLYALLSRRVDRAGIVVQRALVFAIADRTLAVLAFVPLAVLILVFYSNRDRTIGELLAARLPLVGALTLVAVAGLFYASAIRGALERLFFRGRADSRRILRNLAASVRDAADAASLERLLAAEIDRALHVESAALFTHDPRRGLLHSSGSGLAPLDASSQIARLAAQRETLELDAPLLETLPATERYWAAQRQFRLIVPLIGPDSRLLGAIALGEKMSGLPFDAEDRLMLTAVAGAAVLALENLRLRASPTVSDDSECARYCSSCDGLFEPLAERCEHDATPLVHADAPWLLHGKFRFERRIGAGAMGVVYRASDLVLGRDVAVKTLPELGPEAAARFEREARAVAALSHPSIATIHSAELWRGRAMLVFELLEGGTLEQRMRRGPLPAEEVLRIGIAVADGLMHAHAAGILHRDIKPSNIGFTRNGAPKVLDFGLARFMDDATAITLSGSAMPLRRSSGIAGTPLYLSPETVVGQAPTPMVDVWSIAVTLYEALTGVNPFEEATVTLTMNRILSHDVPDPRRYREDVPAGLAELLLHALARDSTRRLSSAAELRDALGRT